MLVPREGKKFSWYGQVGLNRFSPQLNGVSLAKNFWQDKIRADCLGRYMKTKKQNGT